MAFNFFGEIPYEFITDIIGKMTLPTLTRMRQTCKSMNAFVEQNQKRIRVTTSVPSVLKVSLDTEKMALSFKLAYWTANLMDFANLSHELEKIPEHNFKIVENPVETSIAKFNFIYLDLLLNHEEADEHVMKQAEIVEGLQAHLDSLRLTCDWLCLTPFSSHIVKDLLEKIKFNYFYYSGQCNARDVATWQIQHCENIHLLGFVDAPRMAPLFIGSSTGTMYFHYRDGVEEMIKDFLREIKNDHTLVGNLKTLAIYCADVQKIEGIDGLQEIFEMYDFTGARRISKLQIDKGFLYLACGEGCIDFQFSEHERDEEIIDHLAKW